MRAWPTLDDGTRCISFSVIKLGQIAKWSVVRLRSGVSCRRCGDRCENQSSNRCAAERRVVGSRGVAVSRRLSRTSDHARSEASTRGLE